MGELQVSSGWGKRRIGVEFRKDADQGQVCDPGAILHGGREFELHRGGTSESPQVVALRLIDEARQEPHRSGVFVVHDQGGGLLEKWPVEAIPKGLEIVVGTCRLFIRQVVIDPSRQWNRLANEGEA